MDNTFYKQLIESSPIAYAYQRIICDEEGTPFDYEFLEANEAFGELSGLDHTKIIGNFASKVLPIMKDEEIKILSIFADVAINGGKKEIEIFSEHTKHWHKIDVYSLEKDYFITFITDTGRALVHDESSKVEVDYKDQLEKLQDELEKLDNQKYVPLTLIMVDINGLKLSIDAFGDGAGEIILKKVEEILKKECRSDDFIARIGEDEFIMLLTRVDSSHAEKIVFRINSAISKEKFNNVSLSVSIGFAIKQNENDNMNDVFNRAEEEMFRHSIFEGANMKRKAIDIILDTLFERSKREMIHSKRVSEYCVRLATKMNFTDKEIKRLRLTGLMHDIGKIGVDAKILNKEKILIGDEWHEIMKHPEIGHRILSSVNELTDVSEIVLQHHEKWNGKGYPKGLKGEEISLSARIIAIADAFSAMTSDRPFLKTLTEEEAIAEIEFCAGVQFDPHLSKIFIEMIKEES